MVRILKFYADWCSPCRVLDNKLDGLDIPIQKVNIELDVDATMKYSVRSVPQLIFVSEDGTELKRLNGVVEKQAVRETYDFLINNKN